MSLNLSYTCSDRLNNGVILPNFICTYGINVNHLFISTPKGFSLNFNIMISFFLMVGLALATKNTPMRYVICMKRSSSNVSGIRIQVSFMPEIMGISFFTTGLVKKTGQVMASVADYGRPYPFFAYLPVVCINFAIPSAGGEFAV